MPKHIQISLLLLSLVVIDASGDALGLIGWQIPSHTMEVVQVAGWILIWALYGFKGYYIVMYVLGRIWAFDLVHNLWTGEHILYMGLNDIFGLSVRWFADLVKQNYYHFSFMLKFISLVWWVAWLLTDGNARALFIRKPKM
jgi:hypothetical protein